MERELEAVRKRGYAISEGEFERGLVGLAAPVREDGMCVAALCISGPEYRLDREAAGALAPSGWNSRTTARVGLVPRGRPLPDVSCR